jgi:hypothetical protein
MDMKLAHFTLQTQIKVSRDQNELDVYWQYTNSRF